jgi:hypothetical protein
LLAGSAFPCTHRGPGYPRCAAISSLVNSTTGFTSLSWISSHTPSNNAARLVAAVQLAGSHVALRHANTSIPEPGPSALGIGPADKDELLTVRAFGLDPETAIAGRVRRIGALRDDSNDNSQALA